LGSLKDWTPKRIGLPQILNCNKERAPKGFLLPQRLGSLQG
jgi:hypothetical protein